ncbi:isochorismatase family protein [Patescibacteria group bacterium]|nr:isochorismatase family protein [Patescibacteria group bacterium]MDE1946438.1 isochorismatase family protein [Patescibacteria group bacterium]MDE2011046.1 isochorismatase family protein [Patescibacteria group bacterium]MDE2233525.1 isochorismatase family protein [Patescibacteria group bacterium]
MVKVIAVDLQYDFTRPEGKHFKSSRTCLETIKLNVIPILLHAEVDIGEIISDYRQPRPGDLDDSCNPGTWGYTSEIPDVLVGSRWVKCMNSPFFTRDNIGVADKPPGLPRAFPELFYDWLASFVKPDDTVVLFGLTLDCCVLCTAQAIRFKGYDVRILLDATDTYDGGEESRRQTMDLVVSNWAKPMTIDEFRLANFGNTNVQQHQ